MTGSIFDLNTKNKVNPEDLLQDKNKPCKEAIAALETALEYAKKGEIQEVFLLGADLDGSIKSSHAGILTGPLTFALLLKKFQEEYEYMYCYPMITNPDSEDYEE